MRERSSAAAFFVNVIARTDPSNRDKVANRLLRKKRSHDALRKRERLSRARACSHHHRLVQRFNDLALTRRAKIKVHRDLLSHRS